MDRQHVTSERELDPCRVTGSTPSRERAIAELAGRQHGVVTRKQLFDLGLSCDAVDNRVKAGRLHSLYRGVYLLGHVAAPPYAREMAAVLTSGPGAVISHCSAAYVRRLLPYPAHLRVIDVTVSGRNPGSRPGICLHRRMAPLDPRDVGLVAGIPVTNPARTLLDLGGSIAAGDLERALAVAYARRLVSRGVLMATLARAGRTGGVAAFRRLLDDEAGPALTRSEAEARLLHLIRLAQLPHPAANARVGRHEVDLLWRAQRLVVEVDGFQFHSSRVAFERDRARDAVLQTQGFRVMRVTSRQIVDEPQATLARIAQALVIGTEATSRAE
jgi:very-short-patch-repair endonuclease